MTDKALPAGLSEVIAAGQRHGWIGAADPSRYIKQSQAFVDAIAALGATTVVELGSGGGIPGLVVALGCPEVELACLDADLQRVDHLWWAVQLLDLDRRVSVHHGRAEDFAHLEGWRSTADAVIARSFAPPPITAECASGFLRVGGSLLATQHPDGDAAWDDDGLAILGLRAAALPLLHGAPSSRAATAPSLWRGIQRELCPPKYPRTATAQRRSPLWSIVSRETFEH